MKENTTNQAETRQTSTPPTPKPLKLKPPPTTKPSPSTRKPRKPKTKPVVENQPTLETFLKPNHEALTKKPPTRTQGFTNERISKPTPETSLKKKEPTKPEENQTRTNKSNAKAKPETISDHTKTEPKKTTARNPVQKDIRSLLAKKILERVEKLKIRTDSNNASADHDFSVHPSDQAPHQPSSNNETSGVIMLGGKKTISMVQNRVGSSSESSNVDKSDWNAAQNSETSGQS